LSVHVVGCDVVILNQVILICKQFIANSLNYFINS
jgi:hypothetical protein